MNDFWPGVFVGCVVGFFGLWAFAYFMVSNYDTETVAKICRNGSIIYKKADGNYRYRNASVENIDKVCQ